MQKSKLRDAISEIIPDDRYTELFFQDVFNLWEKDNFSPEVILREIKILEGKEDSLMVTDSSESIPVWFASNRSTNNGSTGKPNTYLNSSPSATKGATQFKRKNSPLYGLWHKHYYVHQKDMCAVNIENARKTCEDATPIIAMCLRVAEGKLTGEWIIFERINDDIRYLCLAKHDEGDEIIAKRLIDNNINLS